MTKFGVGIRFFYSALIVFGFAVSASAKELAWQCQYKYDQYYFVFVSSEPTPGIQRAFKLGSGNYQERPRNVIVDDDKLMSNEGLIPFIQSKSEGLILPASMFREAIPYAQMLQVYIPQEPSDLYGSGRGGGIQFTPKPHRVQILKCKLRGDCNFRSRVGIDGSCF
jgi:hypothetical protein